MFEALLWATWLMLGLVAAVPPLRMETSRFELERRKAAGDLQADKQLRRDRDAPLIAAGLRAIVLLLLVCAVSLSLQVYGPGAGFALSIAGVLLGSMIVRHPRVAGLSAKLQARYYGQLATAANKAHFLLQPLTPTQNDRADVPAFSSREELQASLRRTSAVSVQERERLLKIMALSESHVADVMTPWPRVETVKESETVGPLLLDRLHKTGLSAFPVYGLKRSLVGILLMSDAVPLRKDATTVHQLMRKEVAYIRNDAPLEQAVGAFLHTGHHLFIVIDASRQTVGSISFEQVLQFLLGRTIKEVTDDFHNIDAVAERTPHPAK